MKKFISNNKITLSGLLTGAGLGFLYYYFIGCASGACPITSDPFISTVYGAFMGGVFFNLFEKKDEPKNLKKP